MLKYTGMDSHPFWNLIEEFHTQESVERLNGVVGLAAVQRLRELLEPNWKVSATGRHPLEGKLRLGSEQNYWWLSHFVRKLDEVGEVPGSETVVSRLASADEYAGALAELDFALKLKLSGHQTRFVARNKQPTPDLVTKIQNQEVEVEITSFNPSDEDRRSMEAIGIIQVATLGKAVAGGVFGRVPSDGELNELKEDMQRAIGTAEETQDVVPVNIPGLLNILVADRGSASKLPEKWRGLIEMRTKTPLPKKDRLARLVEEKVKHHFSNTVPSVLVVYDRLTWAEKVREFFDDPQRDVEDVVGTFPNVVGVILVHPFTSHRPLEPERIDLETRSFLGYSMPDNEAERCIVWRNPMSEHPALESVISCFTEFPSNLERLFGS